MRIPIGISNRHVHLSQADANTLFGANYQLEPMKDLSQPGQFAGKETVILKGPKGEIPNVRILGPYRKFSQVEIMASDQFKLGVEAPLRESGDLEGSGSIDIIGPKGTLHLNQGLIIAKRHIHMSVAEAKDFGVENGDIVQVKVLGERGLIFDNIVIRAADNFLLDMHIDMDEGNAAGLGRGAWGEMIIDKRRRKGRSTWEK